jgi:soluble P-type ATPase
MVVDFDYSPDYGFFSIHSCNNFRRGKAEILEELTNAGHIVISIGDSLSDYADVRLPNQVIFVQLGLPEHILQRPHVTVSEFKGISGVIESLNKILQGDTTKHIPREDISYDM